MTRHDSRPGKVSQKAEASGQAAITQIAGDQHNHYHLPPQRRAAAQVVSLPPAPLVLVGREERVDVLLSLLAPDENSGGDAGAGSSAAAAVVVSAVQGLAGIGKTALALTAAHHAVRNGWFTGGALFIDMAGYALGGSVSAGQAIGMLLRALGVPDEELPLTVEEQAGLYQAELTRCESEGRRVLILADNVSTASQVQLLVPASRSHRLLVTSRNTLASLTQVGARLIGLDELEPDAAVELIRRVLLQARPGDARPGTEVEALGRVAGLCGRLPLALQIVAAILVDDPGLPIADLAEHLADERTRLDRIRRPDDEVNEPQPGTDAAGDEMGGESAPVRAAFFLSYRRLTQGQQRVFRLLSLNPGPDIATDAAAALIGTSTTQIRPLLMGLVRASLLAETAPGAGRWRMHDLLHLYATELADDAEAGEELVDAVERLLKYYLNTASAADEHLRALPGTPVPDRFNGRQEAMAWLAAERPNLTATVTWTATIAPAAAVELAAYLAGFLRQRRHFDDAIDVGLYAVASAAQLDDWANEAGALVNLGLVLAEARQFEKAIGACAEAVTIFRDLDDQHGEEVIPLPLRNIQRLSYARDDDFDELIRYIRMRSCMPMRRAAANSWVSQFQSAKFKLMHASRKRLARTPSSMASVVEAPGWVCLPSNQHVMPAVFSRR